MKPGCLAHRLVVVALRAHALTLRGPHPGALGSADGEPPEDVAAGAVLVVADHVGSVLVESAAGRDRHQLHAAAHAEHRQADLVRRGQQRELPGVAVLAPPGRRGCGSSP